MVNKKTGNRCHRLGRQARSQTRGYAGRWGITGNSTVFFFEKKNGFEEFSDFSFFEFFEILFAVYGFTKISYHEDNSLHCVQQSAANPEQKSPLIHFWQIFVLVWSVPVFFFVFHELHFFRSNRKIIVFKVAVSPRRKIWVFYTSFWYFPLGLCVIFDRFREKIYCPIFSFTLIFQDHDCKF